MAKTPIAQARARKAASAKSAMLKSAEPPKGAKVRTKPTLVGNDFWRARTTHGRDKLFTSPEILQAACHEYFDWNRNNPLFSAEAFAFKGDVNIEAIPKMRAMTVGGLCIFLGISQSTWFDYVKREGFSEICAEAMEVIRQQKFEGASAGLLNAAIIARDLGLADKKEVTGANGGPIRTINRDMTPQEAAEAYAASLREGEDD
jgi:hypothetical protein